MPLSASEKYTLGYGSGAMSWMNSRTLDSHGAFMLPWLEPEQQLLDCGCGPGSMTLGFAGKLSQGKVVGVDIEPGQFAAAQTIASAQGIDNVSFQQADLYQLPFAGESFDVVFGSAVLSSLSDPEAAIKEMMRVLRPGGIIGLKEFDHEGDLFYPMNPMLARSIELYLKIREHNGHEVAAGRKLKAFFVNTSCKILSLGACCDHRMTSDELRTYVDLSIQLQTEVLEPQYLALGWCEPGEVAEHAKAWDAFARDPRAMSVSVWVEAVGRKYL